MNQVLSAATVIVEPVLTVGEINTNNHYEYSPYYSLGDLVYVDHKWWRSLHPDQRSNIRAYFGEQYGYTVRHNIRFTGEVTDAYWAFHNAYINSYNLSFWVNCMDAPYSVSNIDSATSDGMISLSEKCMIRERMITPEDIDFYQPLVANSLRKYFARYNAIGLFVKVSDKRSKKSILSPVYTLEQMVSHIVHDRDMIQSIIRHGHQASILLTPWRYEIDSRNDFRVIVYNCHIVGISQQKCYKYVGLTSSIVKTAAESIITLYNKIKKNLHYHTCVLDVWVDNVEAHLIGVNPGDLWASSGSALFNWVKDYHKLHQRKNIYVRYIDIQSPLIKSHNLFGIYGNLSSSMTVSFTLNDSTTSISYIPENSAKKVINEPNITPEKKKDI
jgi:hypothetical protein